MLNSVDIKIELHPIVYAVRHDKKDKYNNVDSIANDVLIKITKELVQNYNKHIESNNDNVQIRYNNRYISGIELIVDRSLAYDVLERAKMYCPVDSGALRESGRIEVKNNITYVIFGDTVVNVNGKLVFVDYAYYVHEATWKNIRRDKNPYARAKFLEIAYDEILREFKSR